MVRDTLALFLVAFTGITASGETFSLTVEGDQIRVENDRSLATASKVTLNQERQTLQLEGTPEKPVKFVFGTDSRNPLLPLDPNRLSAGLAEMVEVSLASELPRVTILGGTKVKSFRIDELSQNGDIVPNGAKEKFERLNLKEK